MAWIESHQELAHHPKTKRAAKLLGASIPSVVGHLHLLWWWALSYADDGNISNFTADEIADAAMWEGDAEDFISALSDCGMGDQEGFIERAPGHVALHDWWSYAGKLVEKRRSDAIRKRVQRTSSGHPADGAKSPADGAGTQPNTTQQNTTKRRVTTTTVPENWKPSEDQTAAAKKKYPHLNIALEAEKFREWHGAKGTKYADWRLAFWTWLRKAAEFNPAPAPRPERNDDATPLPSCEHATPMCMACRAEGAKRARALAAGIGQPA